MKKKALPFVLSLLLLMSFTVGSFGQVVLSENFEDIGIGGLPLDWSVENGVLAGSTEWIVSNEATSEVSACEGSKFLLSDYPEGAAQNNWVFTGGLSLDAGNYKLTFYYKTDIEDVEGKLAVKYGSGATINDMTKDIVEYNTFSNDDCVLSITTFEIESTETYYLGWHSFSADGEAGIEIDDIVLEKIVEGDITWTGATDTDWNKAANWDLGVPGATSNVTIPDHTDISNSPVIGNGETYSCASITINEAGRLTNNGTLTVYGNLLIKSDASNTGSLVNTGTLTVNGTSVVKRYMNGWKVDDATENWHFLSPPISGALSGVFNNCFLNYHNEADNQYHQVDPTATLTQPLNVMQGYAAMYAYNAGYTDHKILSFSGALNDGAIGADNNLTRTADGNSNGWNLVGNPYPSSIDWEAGSGWTKTNITPTIYTWSGQFMATYNSQTHAGTSLGSRYIAPMQGFYVEVNDEETQGTLKMTNDIRVHNDYAYYKGLNASDIEYPMIVLNLFNGEYTDETKLIWIDNATMGFDAQYDARKFSNSNLVSDICFIENGNLFAVNAIPANADNFEISLCLNIKSTEQHILSFNAEQFGGYGVMLIDKYANEQIDLINNPSYSFNSSEGVFDDRFDLVFTKTTGVLQLNASSNLLISKSHNNIVISSQQELHAPDLSIYDSRGILVYQAKISGSSNSINVPLSLSSGVYVVKLITEGTLITKKFIY